MNCPDETDWFPCPIVAPFGAKGATWNYNAGANVAGITKKDRPLTPFRFAEFETCYASCGSGFQPAKSSRRRAENLLGRRDQPVGLPECSFQEFPEFRAVASKTS